MDKRIGVVGVNVQKIKNEKNRVRSFYFKKPSAEVIIPTEVS